MIHYILSSQQLLPFRVKAKKGVLGLLCSGTRGEQTFGYVIKTVVFRVALVEDIPRETFFVMALSACTLQNTYNQRDDHLHL